MDRRERRTTLNGSCCWATTLHSTTTQPLLDVHKYVWRFIENFKVDYKVSCLCTTPTVIVPHSSSGGCCQTTAAVAGGASSGAAESIVTYCCHCNGYLRELHTLWLLFVFYTFGLRSTSTPSINVNLFPINVAPTGHIRLDTTQCPRAKHLSHLTRSGPCPSALRGTTYHRNWCSVNYGLRNRIVIVGGRVIAPSLGHLYDCVCGCEINYLVVIGFASLSLIR